MRLEGGRTATPVTQGGEKNLLQPRFLRNSHKLRLEKYPHNQTELLLIPSSKITFWKEEEDVAKQLNLSGKARDSSLLQEKPDGVPKPCSTDRARESNLGHQPGALMVKQEGENILMEYSDEMRAPGDPFGSNHKIMT